jgi:inositol-phosphate phosphatase/L-galactose 1-phosphate phosphatase/histidinol-phosphatase
MEGQLDEFVAFASRLADESGPIARRYFQARVAVDEKSDGTPVTVADREVETSMRRAIEAAYPAHGIVGEEYGSTGRDAEYVWVVDPIDGTAAFITGIPLFGTLIALLHRGGPVLGVIDHPALGYRWLGARGRPTTFNGAPAAARPCADLASAALGATTPQMFTGADWDAFDRLRRTAGMTRWGTDCFAYGQVASGLIDLVVEAGLKTEDYMALVAVVEGAGGVITDWRGRPLHLDSDGHVIAAGDRRVHAAAMALLAG